MSSIIVDIDKLDRKARLASLKWIVSHLMKNRLSFGIVIFGLISINAITALLPYLIGVMIDEAVIPNDRELVIQFALVILILGVSRVLLGYLMIFNNNILSWNAIKSIRIEFFENVQRKPLKFHNKAKSGDLMAMATNDMNQLGFMINPGMRLVSEAFLTLVFVIILALRTDRTMATFLLPFFLVYLLAIRRYNESMTPIARVFQEKWSKISRTAQDSITGVRVVRAFNAEDHEKAKFRQVVDDFKITWKQRQMLTARYWPQLIIYLTIGSSFLFGIWLVGENRLSVGQLIGINGMLILLIPPTFLISFAINMLQGGLAGGERIFHTMMVEEHEDKSDHEKQLWPENVAGKIEFKHVNFRYEEAENYVLKDINLVIEPGETVALVGPTGCGKTSLTKLLLRFFEYEGEITIDGTDIHNIKLRELRQNMGRVEQDVFIYASTIRENLIFGLGLHSGVSNNEIIKAAKVAQAHDFIMEQENGYDTVVGERGFTLSGGQRQRIAIARALLVDPKILILDDSTSAIDSDTEERISQAIDEVIKNRTTFLITHRLNAIRKADKIVLIKQGSIKAIGRHEDLIQTSKDYRRIFSRHIALPEIQTNREI